MLKGFTFRQGVIILVIVAAMVWFWLWLHINDWIDSLTISASIQEHSETLRSLQQTPEATPTPPAIPTPTIE